MWDAVIILYCFLVLCISLLLLVRWIQWECVPLLLCGYLLDEFCWLWTVGQKSLHWQSCCNELSRILIWRAEVLLGQYLFVLEVLILLLLSVPEWSYGCSKMISFVLQDAVNEWQLSLSTYKCFEILLFPVLILNILSDRIIIYGWME